MAAKLLVAYTPPNGTPLQYTAWLNNVTSHGWELIEVAYNPSIDVVMNYFRATSPAAAPEAVHALSFGEAKKLGITLGNSRRLKTSGVRLCGLSRSESETLVGGFRAHSPFPHGHPRGSAAS